MFSFVLTNKNNIFIFYYIAKLTYVLKALV